MVSSLLSDLTLIFCMHEQIMQAKTCGDLYRVVGEDFWLATWCNSTAVEG